jgi:GT2 family glycosyltransferase
MIMASAKKANFYLRSDIILPFYNELDHLRACIESILKNTDSTYRLFLIDDGSDEYTKNQVQPYRVKFKQISVLRNPRRLGYVRSYNIGLTLSKADYIVLLSPHTYVLPGWLEKMVECAESDERIGIINPLTNEIGDASIEIPPGFTIYTMNDRISQVSERRYPDITAANEFCMLMKRTTLNDIGFFDQCPNTIGWDAAAFCTNAISNGWRVVAADDTFVFHHYFGVNKENENSGFSKKKARFSLRLINHQKCKKHRIKILLNHSLRYIREALLSSVTKKSFFNAYFSRITHFLRSAFAVIDLLKDSIKYFRNRRFDKLRKNRREMYKKLRGEINRLATGSRMHKEYIENLPVPKGISIAFLVSNIHAISGGLISILQFVNEFIHRGHTAYIVTCDYGLDQRLLNLYTCPIRYMNPQEMANFFPKADIIVATYWTTAFEWVPKIMRSNPFVLPYYFIQGFESWFYPEGDKNRKRVRETYSLIPNKIVVSKWLSNMLRDLGYDDTIKISPGINLDVFYPRGSKGNAPPYRIAAIARPQDKVKGFSTLIEVFKSLYKDKEDVEIIFFGAENLSAYKLPFPYHNYGEIWDQNKIAEIYSSAHLLVDVSSFHGFGLPGLEAMACGTPVVLTNVGGIMEYAEDGANCLMVNPHDIKSIVDAIEALLDNPSLRKKLIRRGRNTVQKFCLRGEAEKMLSLFLKQLEEKGEGKQSSFLKWEV